MVGQSILATPTMNANISPGVCYTFQSLVSFQYMYITFSSNRPKSNVLVSIIITNRMSDRRNIWGFPCDSALIHVRPLYIISYIIHHIFFQFPRLQCPLTALMIIYIFSVLRRQCLLLTATELSPPFVVSVCSVCVRQVSVRCCLCGIYYVAHMNQGTSICFPSHHR